ncbi:MAG: hypothetical protein KKE23_00945 [Nanoarchaeota archaeon]|nr:hypothetical protein [Nanoarchaeota archaeon]
MNKRLANFITISAFFFSVWIISLLIMIFNCSDMGCSIGILSITYLILLVFIPLLIIMLFATGMTVRGWSLFFGSISLLSLLGLFGILIFRDPYGGTLYILLPVSAIASAGFTIYFYFKK